VPFTPGGTALRVDATRRSISASAYADEPTGDKGLYVADLKKCDQWG
jgi:hypothetical protein